MTAIEVNAATILAITFTKKAATELRERVAGNADKGPPVHVLTFHAWCFRMLRDRAFARKAGFKRSVTIWSKSQQQAHMMQAVLRAKMDHSLLPQLRRVLDLDVTGTLSADSSWVEVLATAIQRPALKGEMLAARGVAMERLRETVSMLKGKGAMPDDADDMPAPSKKKKAPCPGVTRQASCWAYIPLLQPFDAPTV